MSRRERSEKACEHLLNGDGPWSQEIRASVWMRKAQRLAAKYRFSEEFVLAFVLASFERKFLLQVLAEEFRARVEEGSREQGG